MMAAPKKPFRIKIENLLRQLENNSSSCTTAYFDTLRLESNDFKRLAKALSQNTFLKILNLNDCGITAKDIPLLAAALEHNKTITDIQIQSFENYDAETKKLVQKIIDCAKKNEKQQDEKMDTCITLS